MRDAWLLARWPLAGAVAALTTVRTGGASRGPFREFNLATHVGDAPAAVRANRALLGRELGLERIQWLSQVHGSRCLRADAATLATAPEADAAWTDQRRFALAVLTADCLPVVVCDGAGSVVGIAHAGWRGLVRGVLGALVAALPRRPEDLVAWIGPGIGPQAYEVGAEVVDAVADLLAGPAAGIYWPGAGAGKYQLDLTALATELLARHGVTRVFTERVCTFRDARFYSHRREGPTGRMATLAWLPD